MTRLLALTLAPAGLCAAALAQETPRIEISDDGHETVVVRPSPTDGAVTRGGPTPFGGAPDWVNTLRRQVGALQIADMNNDGLNDLVVGCYISNSFPPYDDWENLIYYNSGGGLEAEPSWVSNDEVSTGDLQVGDINNDGYPDIFCANGGTAMSRNVVYFGGPGGPNPTPGWTSLEPTSAWTNYAALFDIDHDGDLDVVTCNQGQVPQPYRPMFFFRNNNGVLENVPSWQSSESSIQNFIAVGDYDHDGWEEIAVSKWTNGFQSGIYENNAGTLSPHTTWTTGSSDTDKGVAWADVDGNGWIDLALGRDPTLLFSNDGGVLTNTWASDAPFYSHSDLRFCDVDGDGDPDLAETHFSDGRTHIYINHEGTLNVTPSWTYDSTAVGTAIAFGDLNGDDQPDLAIGYSGQPSIAVFYNTTPPPCPGDLDGDGSVELSDLAILLANYGQSGGAAQGDLDDDGEITLADLSLLLSAFGTTCA